MNIQQLGYSILLFLAASCVGYFLRVLHDGSVSSMATGQLPVLEYFVSAQSFSEVESQKAVLSGLSARILTELRVARGVGVVRPPARQSYQTIADPKLAKAIRDLEQEIEEFNGSEQQHVFVQDLLWLLKRERLYDPWITLYLKTLYEHPTDELVGRLASEAIPIGKTVGREQEVLIGFRHLSRIPLDFGAKRQVNAILNQTSGQNQFTSEGS